MKQFEIQLDYGYVRVDGVLQLLKNAGLELHSFSTSDQGGNLYVTVDTDELGVTKVTQRINDIIGISVISVEDVP